MISRYDMLERLQRHCIFFGLKNAYLRLLGAKIGKNVSLLNVEFTSCHNFKNLTIGDNVSIQNRALFDMSSPITIGDNSILSYQVTIITHQGTGRLNPRVPTRKLPIPVTIGEWVYIGAGVTILGGVTIGNHSVVGAGTLVTKDVPPNCLAMGVPVRYKEL